jgi:hypothetical protein
VKEFAIYDFPFLFNNAKEADAVTDGPFGQKLMAKLEDKGLVGLGYWDLGFRNLTNSKRPITKAEDIAGLKIRVIPNPINIDWVSALGANPRRCRSPSCMRRSTRRRSTARRTPTPPSWRPSSPRCRSTSPRRNHHLQPAVAARQQEVLGRQRGREEDHHRGRRANRPRSSARCRAARPTARSMR